MMFIAHVKKENAIWKTQSVLEHAEGVARFAFDFANEFGNGDWGRLLQLWHDLGKYLPDFQIHIRKKNGYDSKNKSEFGHVNHSDAGMMWSFSRFEMERSAF